MNFAQRMEALHDMRINKEKLKEELAVLKRKLKTVQLFDMNFFAKLEEASTE